MYVGGYFTRIGGQARSGIAALDASSGRASAWNPHAQPADSGVGALAVSGSTVYAGGKFQRIGGQARNGLAALDAATGRAIPLHARACPARSRWRPPARDCTSAATTGSPVVDITP